MNIGLDVNPLFTGHRFRGIGFYTKNLCHYLINSEGGHSYHLYRSFGNPDSMVPGNVDLYTLGGEKDALCRSALENGLDVLHITDYYHPVYTLSGLEELKKHGVKLVVSVADTIPLRFPEIYPSEKQFMEKNLTPLLSLANYIIAISRATVDDFIRFFSLPPSRFAVTHLGYNPEFCSPGTLETDVLALKKYGICLPFFLYVGGFDWRKNCETTLRAFKALLWQHPQCYQMVFVGNDPPTPVMREAMADITQSLVFTGFIPEMELAALYRRAIALVFPSRYEGFGLPVLEAMACGTPVISSDRGSLPEIVENGGLLLDPKRPDLWTEAMKSLIFRPALAQALRERGLARAQKFSWDRCARETLDVYLSCIYLK